MNLLPDALADALGRVVADVQRDCRKDFDRLKAESRAVISELRAEVLGLRDELRSAAEQDRQAIIIALASIKDGKDADPDVVRELIADAVAAIPEPRNGKDADPEEIAALVASEVEKAVSELPMPKDGKDGVGLASAFIDRGGALVLTLTDGSTKDVGQVVGKDADEAELARMVADGVAKIPTPKDGVDGVGFDDLSVEHDGERGITLRFVRGKVAKEFPLSIPAVLDRGVFKAGETYTTGDAVTWAGSLWIAQGETSEKPDSGKGWRLAVKRGRDGKDSKAA